MTRIGEIKINPIKSKQITFTLGKTTTNNILNSVEISHDKQVFRTCLNLKLTWSQNEASLII